MSFCKSDPACISDAVQKCPLAQNCPLVQKSRRAKVSSYKSDARANGSPVQK